MPLIWPDKPMQFAIHHPWLLCALLASACPSPDKPKETAALEDTSESVETGPVDADGDGWSPVDGDCDDADPLVHPGAAETCDGVDENCDGSVDEGLPDTDADGIPDCRDEEVCDGLDNDGDAQVDEGFPDVDTDGTADCVDGECSVASSEAAELGEATACTVVASPPIDPWNVEVAWEHLEDESVPWDVCGDDTVIADLDHDGVSDVLCTGNGSAMVAVHSGLDGSVLRWFHDLLDEDFVGNLSPVAVADVEGDGVVDIFVLSQWGFPARLDEIGNVIWMNTTMGYGLEEDCCPLAFFGYTLDLVDLDSDGVPEGVTNHGAFSTTDGSPFVSFDVGIWDLDYDLQAAVAGPSGDGGPWIADRDKLFAADGSLVWSLGLESGRLDSITPLLVQADGDDSPEVAFVAEEEVTLADDDGAGLWTTRHESETLTTHGCAGDVDGDGAQELVYQEHDAVVVLDLTGERLWSRSLGLEDADDMWGDCSTFDLDLDGAAEILLADREAFRILDGRTGDVRYEDPERRQMPGGTPMPVDLDNDGVVEILVPVFPRDEPSYSLRLYRNANRDWPPGSPLWPSPRWSGTSHQSDLTIPRTPPAPWLTTGVWRGQAGAWIPGTDLRPEIVSSCVSSCEGGNASLSVRVVNLGPEEVRDGVPVSVWALGSDGARTLQSVTEIPGFLDNGFASASVTISVPHEYARNGLVVIAGDTGIGSVETNDCDLGNNEVVWTMEGCL